MHNFLNVEVSRFNSYTNPDGPITINLLDWLQSDEFRQAAQAIRATDDKAERKALKAKLPAITPSGIFRRRAQDALIKHSGLIQFDIDLTGENRHITNWTNLKNEIFKIKNVAYIGLSISGQGFWGLIPISDPDRHEEHFRAIEILFSRFGIKIDTLPKNVASLRGASYDPDAYFRPEAATFNQLVSRPRHNAIAPISQNFYSKASSKLDWIIDKMNSANEGERHSARLRYAKLCGGYIASGEIDSSAEQALISAYIQTYGASDSEADQAKEIKAIKDGIRAGLSQPISSKAKPPASNWRNHWLNAMHQTQTTSPPPLSQLPDKPMLRDTWSMSQSSKMWQDDIKELETFFSNIVLPPEPIQLNPYTTITNAKAFVSSHLGAVKANNGSGYFSPYLNRLKDFRRLMG
jgi:hypothetical protein